MSVEHFVPWDVLSLDVLSVHLVLYIRSVYCYPGSLVDSDQNYVANPDPK